MTINVGDKIPEMKFKVRQGGDPKDLTTDEIFKGKKVVLFAVPGAFTPTCSLKHLPGFIQHYDDLKKKGVDTVACLSVNDHFVMGAWAKDQGAGDKIMMIADGNGDFTKAVGLTLDGSGFGLGTRSQRYAMVVDNGTVKTLNVEKGGAFEVSSAEAILAAL
jgi:glutaredoxin/glutathione-dependent peroxiredoxin